MSSENKQENGEESNRKNNQATSMQTFLPSMKVLSGEVDARSHMKYNKGSPNQNRKRSAEGETNGNSKKEQKSNNESISPPLGGVSTLLPQKDEQVRPLLVEPESLEGVASAYRYKLSILNRELYGCAFDFQEDSDVFSFQQVNKKRAVKKEDWPVDTTLENPSLHEVQIQLMAGDVEIRNCSGCSMWKELTEKPILVLTPQGNRQIQFVRKPFILVIFRCCPKFHSYAKQFKLNLTVTSKSTGTKYCTTINIYRKKMRQTKNKVDTISMTNPGAPSNPMHPMHAKQYMPYPDQYQPQLLTQQVSSPQLLYNLLYQKNTPPPPVPEHHLPFPPMYGTTKPTKQNSPIPQTFPPQQFTPQSLKVSPHEKSMPSASEEKWLENFLESRMMDRSVPPRNGTQIEY